MNETSINDAMPLVVHTVVDPNPSARHPLCMSFKLDPKLEADTVAVVDWDLSTVRLMNDSRYPWLVLILYTIQKISGQFVLFLFDQRIS